MSLDVAVGLSATSGASRSASARISVAVPEPQ